MKPKKPKPIYKAIYGVAIYEGKKKVKEIRFRSENAMIYYLIVSFTQER